MIIDLTIIIVNYKSWSKLKNCIKSIQNQSHINTQIIVVDNFSNDNKLKHFQNKYNQVNWIENKNWDIVTEMIYQDLMGNKDIRALSPRDLN